MAQEFEDTQEPKDRTALVWLSVIVLIGLMLGALWYLGRPARSGSYARVKHILIPYDANNPVDRSRALELISDLRERIMSGESFEDLAREYSADPLSASRGGDLGVEDKGKYDKKFEEFVWSGDIGEVSDVVQTVHGFHLIKVEQRHLSDADRYEMELELRAKEQLRREEEEERKTPPPPPAAAPPTPLVPVAPAPAPEAEPAPETATPAPEAATPAPEAAAPAPEAAVPAPEASETTSAPAQP